MVAAAVALAARPFGGLPPRDAHHLAPRSRLLVCLLRALLLQQQQLIMQCLLLLLLLLLLLCCWSLVVVLSLPSLGRLLLLPLLLYTAAFGIPRRRM